MNDSQTDQRDDDRDRALGLAALQLCSINESCKMLGVSRWQLYQLINDRQLQSVKIGRRRLVPLVELRRFIASLHPEAVS